MRVTRFELVYPLWKSGVLPLNDTRVAKDAHYSEPFARGQASPITRPPALGRKTGRGKQGLPTRSSRAAVDDADGAVGLEDHILGLLNVREACRT